MKNNLTYFLKLNLGLLLYALGMVVGYEAQVGYAPWEVFHVGLAKVLSLSIGQANIIVGLIILAFLAYKKEAICYRLHNGIYLQTAGLFPLID